MKQGLSANHGVTYILGIIQAKNAYRTFTKKKK